MLSALALGLGFAACGESEEEKAQNQVCDARATTDKIRTHLNAIKDDFNKIADAQGQLTDAAKQQVQNANEQFKSQVDDLITNLGTSV